MLARHIADEDVLWLIDLILASGRGVLDSEYQMVYFPGDDLFAANRPRGLPIGNLTSQHWANVYLDALDHFVKEERGTTIRGTPAARTATGTIPGTGTGTTTWDFVASAGLLRQAVFGRDAALVRQHG